MLAGRLDLVRRKSEQWARELIELGPGNTLLYYKDTRTLTVDLTDADPAAMAQLLDGRRMRLSALVPEPEAHRAAAGRMRTLRRRIVLVAEEQGVEVGRLARGMLRVPPPQGGSREARATRPLRAPLLLQPLRIEPRTTTETDYTVELDQEVEVNPVLLVALRDHHGIDLDIDEVGARLTAAVERSSHPDEQVRAVFDALRDLLASQGRATELEPRTVIGSFAFDKLPMVEDLRSSAELLAQHDVIAAAAGDLNAITTLRDATSAHRVRDADDVSPVDEFLVLDADSSQHRALHAVLDGHHVVIQGPPGTGKSQTIANIIAWSAASGKRVLFVAEKRAAIEAVTDRLVEVGLAELVFDLHGQRSRREVASQVAASLEQLSAAIRPDVDGLHRKLAETRRALVQQAEQVHEKRGPWGLSAYDVYQAVLGLPKHTRTGFRIRRSALERLDLGTVDSLCQELSRFVHVGGLAVRRGDSAWSQADVRDTESAEQMLIRLDAVTGSAWRNSQHALQQLVSRAGLCSPNDLAGWQRTLGLLSGVEQTTRLYDEDIYDERLDALCAAACPRQRRAEYPTSDGLWRRYQLRQAARKRRKAERCDRNTMFAELRTAVRERAIWRELAKDPTAIPRLIGLDGEAERFSQLRDTIAAVALTARLDGPETLHVEKLATKLEELRAEEGTLFKLPELARISSLLEDHGFIELLDELARHDADAQDAEATLRYAWYNSLLDRYRLDIPMLAAFSASGHDAMVSAFRSLEDDHLRFNAARIRRRIAERLRDARDAHPEQNATVLGEAKRKRGHMAVRKLVAAAPEVLLAARPCWAMSPIVASRLLPPQQLFDIVIFDEASQVEPVDAMTSIMRGRQLVVAGDDKQLPPSTYFRTLAGGGLAEDDHLDDEESPPPPRVGDFESVLTCLSTFVPHTYRLRWHYRSEDERLIAFSNDEFYRDLVTFPGRAAEPPLRLHVVDGSATPGTGGLVDEEVERVVELVVEHATEYPQDSLGIITANVKHMDRIDGALRLAATVHTELEEFLARMNGPRRRLFVKSLEMVQGDERDAIILSIGRAKGADGRLRMQFGPINHDGGERRLNVAVTRARRRMHVVSSFTHEDMAPNWPTRGPASLRRFLEFARSGARPREIGRASDVSLNPLEQDVLDALERRGIPVTPQWGESGYRIDFALADPDRPGRMVLALEVDGDRYHRLTSARDRDRLRQAHLERMGWQFHRIWASAWFDDREREADRIEQRWREVVAAPAQSHVPRKSHPVNLEPTTSLRPPRPPVPSGLRIDQYSDHDLDRIARWVLSDDLPLDRETRLRQMRDALDFKKAGSRIVARCEAALDRVRDSASGGS